MSFGGAAVGEATDSCRLCLGRARAAAGLRAAPAYASTPAQETAGQRAGQQHQRNYGNKSVSHCGGDGGMHAG